MNRLLTVNSVVGTCSHVSVRAHPLLPSLAPSTPLPQMVPVSKSGRVTGTERHGIQVVPTHNINAIHGVVGVQSHVRFYHGDIKVPNFDKYKRERDKDPKVNYNMDKDDQAKRKLYSYLILTGGAFIPGTMMAKTIVQTFFGFMMPQAHVRALSCIEINVGKVPEGKSQTFLWRGQPIFVKHRTAEEIEREEKMDITQLRDPEHDHARVKRPDFLIVIASCTHLGCIPLPNKGNYKGGYYCPCHGSHYDGSGRVRQGPAPRNLEVPIYEFLDDETVQIGEEL